MANVRARENRHRQIYDVGKPHVIREYVLDLHNNGLSNYILEGIPKIGLFTLRDVSIIPWMLNLISGLSRLRSCDKELLPAHPQQFEGSIVSPHKSNPLVLQKILARIMLSEKKTSRLLSSCDMSLLMESWSSSRTMCWMQCSALILGHSGVLNS